MPTLKEYGNWKWATLHAEAAAFPENPSEEERIAFVAYMENYAKVFPCPKCRPNLMRYLRDHPIYEHTKTTSTLFMYIFDLHEEVNTHKADGVQSNISPIDALKAFKAGIPWQGFGGYLLLGEKDLGPNGKIMFPSNQQNQDVNLNDDEINNNNPKHENKDGSDLNLDGSRSKTLDEENNSLQISGPNRFLNAIHYKPNAFREIIMWVAIAVLVLIIIGLIVGWVKFPNYQSSFSSQNQNNHNNVPVLLLPQIVQPQTQPIQQQINTVAQNSQPQAQIIVGSPNNEFANIANIVS